MSSSSDVTSGAQILASAYNNLRADVLNTSTGHRHDESDSRKLSTLDTATGHTHNGTDSRVAAPPYYNDILGADVTMTSANTFYTALSRSLAAGTWLLFGEAGFDFLGVTAKLDDGTNVLANGYTAESASGQAQMHLHAVVVLGSTTTIYLKAACSSAGKKVLAIPYANGNSAAKQTQLTCIRIA